MAGFDGLPVAGDPNTTQYNPGSVGTVTSCDDEHSVERECSAQLGLNGKSLSRTTLTWSFANTRLGTSIDLERQHESLRAPHRLHSGCSLRLPCLWPSGWLPPIHLPSGALLKLRKLPDGPKLGPNVMALVPRASRDYGSAYHYSSDLGTRL